MKSNEICQLNANFMKFKIDEYVNIRIVLIVSYIFKFFHLDIIFL